ncbi:MAG: phospho-N-acetylmuramoyl-pentapeptide-transferase [Planctomycetota bacterium]
MLIALYDWLSPWIDDIKLLRFVQVIDQLEFRALLAAVLSLIIVLAFGRRVIAMLVKYKVGDAGLTDVDALARVAEAKANTPTMGGLLIAGSILISTLLLADLGVRWVQIGVVVVLWTAALGAVDDYLKLTAARRSGSRQGLHSWEKLVFQLGLGVIVGYFAYRAGLGDSGPDAAPSLAHALNLPLQKTYESSLTGVVSQSVIYLSLPVYLVIAALMLAGMSNAVNITDGMDGLAAGIGTVVAFGLLVLALIAGELRWAQTLLVPHVSFSGELAVMAGAMAGACLGFLWFNASPANVFMGDTGSLCIGGLIGYLAVVIRQEFVTLLMCGVFLFEIASVVIQVAYFRATGGKRIFKCAPVHHHFHMVGWAEQKIVARAWIATVLLVIVALATLKAR